jgi:hypothetical protein
MITTRFLLPLAVLCWLAPAASAAETTTFESCIDGAGRMVTAEPDLRQTMLVRTALDGGRAVLRYNPGVLPRLTFATRLFFYAHQCARPTGTAAPAQVRRADCAGLSALIGAGLLQRDEAASLPGQLVFTDAEWELLPGPPRVFDFASCRVGNSLRLPLPAAPSDRQADWNACARGCADRLWTCQKTCRGEACEVCAETGRHCRAGCGNAAPDQ